MVIGAFAPKTEKRSFLPNSDELGEKLLYFCLYARVAGMTNFSYIYALLRQTFPHALTKLLMSTRKMAFLCQEAKPKLTVPRVMKSLEGEFCSIE